MEELFLSGLWLVTGLASIPVLVLLAEVAAARRPATVEPSARQSATASDRVAIVVPAHNESTGLLPTLADLASQRGSGDRIVVVADNCSDDTAEIAAAAGVEVIRRVDRERIGKGYALAFGLDHLAVDPPSVVIFFDADCRVAPGVVARLRDACRTAQRPVQAAYLMRSPAGSVVDHRLAEFAWILRNWVRPLGLWRLGLPVQLMGTGMAFAWQHIRNVPLASGHLVEDMKLGLDLALSGNPPMFLPSAIVTSEFSPSARGAETQRQRWIHGHLAMIVGQAPRLLWRGLAGRDPGLVAMALDLAVPPLSLLVAMVAGVLGVTFIAAACGSSPLPAAAAAFDLVLVAATLALAWWRFARALMPQGIGGSFRSILVQKARFYGHLLSNRGPRQWIRTDRGR